VICVLGSRVLNSRYPEAKNNMGCRRFVQVLKAGKGDRWQESASEIEDSDVDRWCVLVNRWSQTLVTVSGFWRSKRLKSCIRIHKIMKSEILKS
jgi:hypothetical protein